MVVSGDIISNGFPNDYSNGEKQRWVVCASQNYPLCIRFTDFSTELNYDFVKIATASGRVVDEYSGSSLPPSLRVSLNTLVSFTSDGSGTAKGFRAEFCKQLLSLAIIVVFCHISCIFCNSGISTCPALAPPQNGQVTGDYYFGSTVTYTCYPGYSMQGPRFATCLASGQWNQPPPICQGMGRLT